MLLYQSACGKGKKRDLQTEAEGRVRTRNTSPSSLRCSSSGSYLEYNSNRSHYISAQLLASKVGGKGLTCINGPCMSEDQTCVVAWSGTGDTEVLDCGGDSRDIFRVEIKQSVRNGPRDTLITLRNVSDYNLFDHQSGFKSCLSQHSSSDSRAAELPRQAVMLRRRALATCSS